MIDIDVDYHEIDSKILGRNVHSIKFQTKVDKDDFDSFENNFCLENSPFYLSCKVEIKDREKIDILERSGFSLSEIQLQSRFNLRKVPKINTNGFYYQTISDQEELSQVLQISQHSFNNDRFSNDPQIPSWFSGMRYAEYVRNSFHSSDEEVWGLFESSSQKIVGFRTQKILDSKKVLLLLGAISTPYLSLGLGPISWAFCASNLSQRGFSSAITHISLQNYPVFNMEFSYFGFKLIKAEAVYRKIYE